MEKKKLRFNGVDCKEQISWGGHVDPKGLLVKGKTYDLDRYEVHSYHTKTFLKEFPGKSFNSVWFEAV